MQAIASPKHTPQQQATAQGTRGSRFTRCDIVWALAALLLMKQPRTCDLNRASISVSSVTSQFSACSMVATACKRRAAGGGHAS